MYFFRIDAHRVILDSILVTYKNPFLHPSRDNPDFHDFVYVTDGRWSFTAGGESFDVYPGDVFVLPAHTGYGGLRPCQAETRTFFIHTPHIEADSDTAPVRGEDGVIPLRTVIHCQGDPVVRSLFEEITTVKCSEIPQKNEIMSGLFQALLCMLYRNDSRITANGKKVVDEALAIIKSNPGIIYKEIEIARMMYVSVKTLRTAFKRQFNKSFYRYQFDYKMEQAFYMLINNRDIKIYEIAYELGFYDEFHLSKSFKKKFGMSPKECRDRFMPAEKTQRN